MSRCQCAHADEECVVAVTARTICGWVKFRECGELCGWTFLLELIWVVYMSYVKPIILCGCETWCLRVSMIGIL